MTRWYPLAIVAALIVSTPLVGQLFAPRVAVQAVRLQAAGVLTGPQLATLKADVAANTATIDLAAWYNGLFSPDFWVWRKDELTNSTSIDGTTFSWVGTGFITRSQGERDAWREMFNGTNSVNPSLAQVRTAFGDIFSGATAPAPANRTHLLTVARRKATRAEKLFATGTGSTASPATMAAEGAISGADVTNARNLP